VATILHVDMDAFFASVEQLHHPEWRGRPLIVGSGPHERGVVSTCSYEARRYGVRSAMPSREAYRLCPCAIFVPPDMESYENVSRRAFEVFESFTPYVEGVSIDEAFMDITGSLHLYRGDGSVPPERRLAEALRAAVRRECGVTCSVGVAPNRLLAKIGSEMHKPNGLAVIPPDAAKIEALLAPMPVGALWGVGKTTEKALAPYGIRTCGDVQRVPAGQLAAILGSRAAAESLVRYARGIDGSEVMWRPVEEKSVSREHTFSCDEPDREAVRAKLLELVSDVGRRFRSSERWACTARLKLRDSDFSTRTRQTRFAEPARDDMTFREKALELFDAELPPGRPLALPVRLVGFGVSNIRHEPDDFGPALFESPSEERRKKRERLSMAIDRLRERGFSVQ